MLLSLYYWSFVGTRCILKGLQKLCKKMTTQYFKATDCLQSLHCLVASVTWLERLNMTLPVCSLKRQ